uniref:Putative peritrophin n=1 Tax=Panstrongylus lignarius TaxID=156445 RepID=A0A224XVN1_9HEMI
MYLAAVSVFVCATFLQSVLAVPLLNAPGCPEPYGVQTYPHPELCDQFFLCTNGTLTLEQCENGLLYDGKGNVHNHCNYHWGVECGLRKAVLVPISSPGCEYRFGIYAEGPHCSTNYIKCADGYPYLNHCDPGLAYDDKTHSCNWPDLLLDQCNPEAVVGFKCPDKVDPHSISAKFAPFPRYSIPGDCEHLVTCVNGFPRLISCEDGKVLDETTLTCEEPEHVPSCGHFKKK